MLDAQLHERVLYVPVGLWPRVNLQVTFFRPEGKGPFPLAVINHGKAAGPASQTRRARSIYITRYFLSRGYAVIVPMLRGFAGSGGHSWIHDCDAEDEGLKQAEDIGQVIHNIAESPDIDVTLDTSQVVVAGQSLGGWNTLAMGALNLPGVKGLVNFAGGRNAPLCKSWERNLAVDAGRYGSRTHVPSIWFYGDNDSEFSSATWRDMFARYTAAGGPAELIAYGRFMNDAHLLVGRIEALPIWVPKLDAFLARVGLPHQNVHPELLPAPGPESARYADISPIVSRH